MNRSLVLGLLLGFAAACGAGLPLPADGGDAGSAVDAGDASTADGGDMLDCTGQCRKDFICVNGQCIPNCDMPTETCP